jgi:hypothetical protein
MLKFKSGRNESENQKWDLLKERVFEQVDENFNISAIYENALNSHVGQKKSIDELLRKIDKNSMKLSLVNM